ncbi:MAG: winged helix-turn-helix domain-containing protein [Candidatus Ranarchaeia archaeon]
MVVPLSKDKNNHKGNQFSDIQDDLALKYSQGARTRTRILKLLNKPMNRNAIARALGLQWHTVSRHIEILKQHGYIKELAFEKRIFYVRT